MNLDAYVDEVLWQIEFQGIVVDEYLHSLVVSYWEANVSSVAAVAMILQIPADTF